MPGGTAVPTGQVVNLDGGREGERRDGKVKTRKKRKRWEGKARGGK